MCVYILFRKSRHGQLWEVSTFFCVVAHKLGSLVKRLYSVSLRVHVLHTVCDAEERVLIIHFELGMYMYMYMHVSLT